MQTTFTTAIAIAIASAVLTPPALAQTSTWSQSADNWIVTQGTTFCLDDDLTTEFSYWRNYDPVACGVTGDYEVYSVTFGVWRSSTPSGSVTITVNLRDGTGFPAGASSAPILGTAQIVVFDSDESSFQTVALSTPALVAAGTQLAVEVVIPGGQPFPDIFWFGSNNLGETPRDSSYFSAPFCGIIDPIPTTPLINDVHLLLDVEAAPFAASIGTSYCTPAVPNSTGLPGVLTARGSATVADGDLVLRAVQLPPGQFAYFLASQSQAMMVPPGSSGVLCVGGNTGRFNQAPQIVQGPVGLLQVDLGSLPVNPPQPALPGETWNFQCWYRDASLGNSTSNLTDAVSVAFL